jgi:hypothetical protein
MLFNYSITKFPDYSIPAYLLYNSTINCSFTGS